MHIRNALPCTAGDTSAKFGAEMNQYKVGDRVRVYGNTQTGAMDSCPNSADGTVTEIHDKNWIQILIDNRTDYTFHYRQCVRLKKKESQYVWLHTSGSGWKNCHDRVRFIGVSVDDYEMNGWERYKKCPKK